MVIRSFPTRCSKPTWLLPERKSLALLIVISSFLCLSVVPASSQTIVDEWETVKAPKPPELKPITVDPKTTAFLVLDIVKQTCNPERRPRCVASVPKIQAFLKQARAKGMPVIFSVTTASSQTDIFKEVAPLDGEPVVKSMADKFFKTDLEKILSDKGIKTVIVVGTAAHGAVLNTGSQAAFRGLQVIVPVDGMSSENTYFDPGVGQQVTLTKFDMIK